jgi:lipid-A-disaccharide synthase
MTPKSHKIMVIAGESSGDTHAAHLIGELQELLRGDSLQIFGATGPKMREKGVETVVSADDFAVVGVPEVLGALPRFISAFRRLISVAKNRRPDVVILVDFPEFNLKFARRMRSMGIPVVYLVSPQLWAWRKYRLKGVKRDVDMVLSIFPFERAWYERNGYTKAFYVGNPTSERITVDIRQEVGRNRIALLPGSRRSEIRRILPVMLEASTIISTRFPESRFMIPAASEIAEKEIENILGRFLESGCGEREHYDVRRDSFEETVASAAVAAVASGTATLETALIGTPMVVVYRSTVLNYLLLRPLISVPFFSLVNLIAEREIAKELIQFDLTPEKLAEELFAILDGKRNVEFREELKTIRDRLVKADDGMSAARRIVEFLNARQQIS